MLLPKVEPTEEGVYVGGSAKSLIILMQELSSCSCISVDLVTSSPERALRSARRHKMTGGAQFVLKNNGKPQSYAFGLVFLFKVVLWALAHRHKSYDIVHGHSGYGAYAWATYLAGKLLGCRSVHTLYCPIENKGFVDGQHRRALNSHCLLRALKKMDRVVAMTQNIKKSLLQAGVEPRKVTVMPNAIDPRYFAKPEEASLLPEALGVIGNAPLLLYAGNLMESKGLDILIDALGRVRAKHPGIKLVLTLELAHKGFHTREEELATHIRRLGLEENITKLGIIDYMPQLVARADIVVSPYRDTQGPSDYPLILMEAMAAGRCVVGTNAGGIPELIADGHNGRLADPTPESLAEVIGELLESPEDRTEMGQNAKKTVREKYSPNVVAEQHIDLYETIIRGGCN